MGLFSRKNDPNHGHESAHEQVARGLGRRTSRTYNTDGSSRSVKVHGRKLTPIEHGAIAMGPMVKGHSGCGHDQRQVEAQLRKLPRSERAEARAEMERIAHRYT
jgi:hypothetical protein